MKKFTIQVVVLFIVIFGSLLAARNNLFSQINPNNSTLKQVQVQIAETTVNAEVADTPLARQKGLGTRDSLDENSGMLFIFNGEGHRTFWMKGMKFPLDLIWIRNNMVVDITKNAQPTPVNVSDDQIPILVISQPVDKVLEVNASFADKHQISIGQSIQIMEK